MFILSVTLRDEISRSKVGPVETDPKFNFLIVSVKIITPYLYQLGTFPSYH